MPHMAQKALKIGLRTLGHYLDGASILVFHPPFQVKRFGVLAHEIAKKDALYLAVDNAMYLFHVRAKGFEPLTFAV